LTTTSLSYHILQIVHNNDLLILLTPSVRLYYSCSTSYPYIYNIKDESLGLQAYSGNCIWEFPSTYQTLKEPLFIDKTES